MDCTGSCLFIQGLLQLQCGELNVDIVEMNFFSTLVAFCAESPLVTITKDQ